MHVAAANPLYLDIASVPAAALERERDVLREQARASGKAEDIIEKMVEGRLRKFYEEVVLLEQIFVVDSETRIAQGRRERGQGSRRADQDRRLRPLCAGRGDRAAAHRFCGRGGGAAQALIAAAGGLDGRGRSPESGARSATALAV